MEVLRIRRESIVYVSSRESQSSGARFDSQGESLFDDYQVTEAWLCEGSLEGYLIGTYLCVVSRIE